MPYVFGPVPSRRLGLSLGVDLIPAKTCSFDCLYCQVGKTTSKTMQRKSFTPVQEVVSEIKERLLETVPNAITLAGSGEPTLHSEIGQIITLIKDITDIDVALLTNGALLWMEAVRKDVLGADIIMPTLSSSLEATFKKIHKPHPQLKLKTVIDGLILLRQEYKGSLFLEMVFLAGINDTDKELEGLKNLTDQISPDKIQLNTVVRPPADSRAMSLDRKRLMEIKDFFGNNAEIIADVPLQYGTWKENSTSRNLLDMVKRRPLRPVDIANSLNLPMLDVETLVKNLLTKGHLRKQKHSGDTYYLNNETDTK